jgi:multisubunit Na+/H+ antiporter MnhB subunit
MRVSKVYVQTGLPATYAANIVTAVILDFRGYDTLGEATVLFVSIVAALTLLRQDGRVRKGEGAAA